MITAVTNSRTLGNWADAIGLNFTADQIYGAVNAFNGYMDGANAIYQQHFSEFQQNAPNMSADQLAAAQTALQAENDSLTQLMEYNNEANNYVSGGGLSGLGILPFALTATELAILGALLGVAIGALIVQHEMNQNVASQAVTAHAAQASKSSAVDVLNQKYQSGQISYDQWQKAIANLTQPPSTDWQAIAGYGVVVALIFGGIAVFRK